MVSFPNALHPCDITQENSLLPFPSFFVLCLFIFFYLLQISFSSRACERYNLWKNTSLDLLLEHLTYKLKGSITRATSLKASINTKVLWCEDSVKNSCWEKNDTFFRSSHLIQIRILHNWIIFFRKKKDEYMSRIVSVLFPYLELKFSVYAWPFRVRWLQLVHQKSRAPTANVVNTVLTWKITFNPVPATVRFCLPTQLRIPVGQEHVTCHLSKQQTKLTNHVSLGNISPARDQHTHFKTAENVCASRAMQITVFAVVTEKQIYYLFY